MHSSVRTQFGLRPGYRGALALVVTVALLGCGSDGFKSKDGDGDTGTTTNPSFALNIEATYYGLGEWNAYVRRDGPTVYSGSGTACTPSTDLTARSCVHGGELRQVDLPSTISSCAGIVVNDDLGAFTWTCAIRFGSARVFSLGLKPNKGLRDLIDPATLAWRPNAVHVTGALTASTDSTVWWPGTPVLALPVNSGTGDSAVALGAAGTVYVATADQATRGYNLAADRVSIVTMGSSRLTYAGGPAANCNSSTGSTTSPNSSTMICGGGHPYLWIEVMANAGSAGLDYNVRLTGSHFSRIHASTFNGGTEVNLGPMNALRLTNLRSQLAQVHLVGVGAGYVGDLQIAQERLNIESSNDNVIERAVISGGPAGVVLNGAARNVLSRVTIFGSDSVGIIATNSGADNNVISHATVVRSRTAGLSIANGSTNTIVHNVLGANAGGDGLVLSATESVSHAALLDQTGAGVHLTLGDQKFSGNLIVGTNGGGDCVLDASLATPGLDATCAGTDRSAGLLTSTAGRTSASAFLGKLVSDDTTSPEDTLGGVADYPAVPSLFDFLSLKIFGTDVLNLFRVWGDDDGPYPATPAGAAWRAPGRAGRIWDLSLAAAGAVVLGTSGDGATANAGVTASAACPAWLSGNRVITDRTGGKTWLANAYERLDDGIGNDNGLCESNEACVAAPNFGAYQGDGDATTVRCTFSPGTVTGVIMYAHPANGR